MVGPTEVDRRHIRGWLVALRAGHSATRPEAGSPRRRTSSLAPGQGETDRDATAGIRTPAPASVRGHGVALTQGSAICTPHAFRHTGKTRSGRGNEGDLMLLGGWRSRAMLDRYGRRPRLISFFRVEPVRRHPDRQAGLREAVASGCDRCPRLHLRPCRGDADCPPGHAVRGRDAGAGAWRVGRPGAPRRATPARTRRSIHWRRSARRPGTSSPSARSQMSTSSEARPMSR